MAINCKLVLLLLAACAAAVLARDGHWDGDNDDYQRKGYGLSRWPAPRTHRWLKFKNGKFRILQIADVHYNNGPTTGCANILPSQLPCSDVNSTDFLADLIAKEKPDLAIFTGDNIIIGGIKNITASQAALTKPLNDARVPYMMTYGNHDCESADCRPELIAADMLQPYSLTRFGPQGLHGEANYAYSIRGADGKPKFALYVFDGGAYDNRMPGSYDWIRADQVDWYNQTSRALKKCAGRTVPAAAFFHIPLPEYDTAWACSSNPRNVPSGSADDFGAKGVLDKTKSGMGLALADACNNGTFIGDFQEGVFSANVNGGLFSAFVDNGDVKMTNVGHDHVNDFCASLYGVRLCYGGGFGYHAYGKAGWPRRARIIDIHEDGQITTYKTLDKWGDYAQIDRETF